MESEKKHTIFKDKEERLILIRPSFKECNVNCSYCPYKPKKNINNYNSVTEEMKTFSKIAKLLMEDNGKKTLFFVPSGELFISDYFVKIFVDLLNNKNVLKCCFQTNLCFNLTPFLDQVENKKVMFWVTYHPDAFTKEQETLFFNNLDVLKKQDIKFSVGIVATKKSLDKLEDFKHLFRKKGIYLWINAMKGIIHIPYNEEEKKKILAIDKYAKFEINPPKTKGFKCSAGKDSIFIMGNGDISRCPMIKEKFGNILKDNKLSFFDNVKICPLDYCPCYIGYMSFKKEEFSRIYGNQIICRLPIKLESNLSKM